MIERWRQYNPRWKWPRRFCLSDEIAWEHFSALDAIYEGTARPRHNLHPFQRRWIDMVPSSAIAPEVFHNFGWGWLLWSIYAAGPVSRIVEFHIHDPFDTGSLEYSVLRRLENRIEKRCLKIPRPFRTSVMIAFILCFIIRQSPSLAAWVGLMTLNRDAYLIKHEQMYLETLLFVTVLCLYFSWLSLDMPKSWHCGLGIIQHGKGKGKSKLQKYR